MNTRVRHNFISVDGIDTFHREAGPQEAPVILLPHGYPCSSFEFGNLMPRLADRWRLVAPDYPGFGYSGTPDTFGYSFDGYASWLNRFVEQLNLDRCPVPARLWFSYRHAISDYDAEPD